MDFFPHIPFFNLIICQISKKGFEILKRGHFSSQLFTFWISIFFYFCEILPKREKNKIITYIKRRQDEK